MNQESPDSLSSSVSELSERYEQLDERMTQYSANLFLNHSAHCATMLGGERFGRHDGEAVGFRRGLGGS